jgi:hypothetical protein
VERASNPTELADAVAELRRLLAVASPGPWPEAKEACYFGDDVRLIAASRNHLPAILDALENAQLDVIRLRGEVEYERIGGRNAADKLKARVAELEELCRQVRIAQTLGEARIVATRAFPGLVNVMMERKP